MEPEEYLDYLIEQRKRGDTPSPVADDELAARMAAVEALRKVQTSKVPQAFAYQLEDRLRLHARQLAQQKRQVTPAARPRLLMRLPQMQADQKGVGWLKLAVALIIICSALAVSARALPHYMASISQSSVDAQIGQISEALAGFNSVMGKNNNHDEKTAQAALRDVATATKQGRAAVAALPAGRQREQAQQDLDKVLRQEEQLLHQALNENSTDWSTRLAITQQLGSLGDPVPIVTGVTLSQPTSGIAQVVLTGVRFAPQVQLVIDDQPGGSIQEETSEQITAEIDISHWSPGTHDVGILDPDGSAAQMDLDWGMNDHDDDNGNASAPGSTTQPGAQSTPPAVDDDGDGA